MKLRILFTGGGTGGHIFPLVALAQELEARGLLAAAAWAGRPEGLERTIVAGYGWAYHAIPASPFRRSEAFGLLRAGLRNAAGFMAARRLLGRESFDLIIGSGGYVSAPTYAAARLRGVPYVIIESNAVLGVANRWFANGARLLCAAFPLKGKPPRTEVLVTGNPVRREFCTPGPAPIPDDWQGKPLLVLVGGSQGAGILNAFIAGHGARLAAAHPGLRIVHIAGRQGAEELARQLAGVPAIKVMPFTTELPALLRQATLVVARAGAMTLCELAYCGVPAVLVPFPHAAENHQYENAVAFAADGRALVVRHDPQDEPATLAQLAAALDGALTAGTLQAMHDAAQKNIQQNPATVIVDQLERCTAR
ncbi:MAG TPA: undecaprenyldiphospho-muramoylpentapeptide beta-N-acetylglucosaminyltransferase [bacterium]|nr:undecaprenyldiphospho-muramoylpentapeptide beta-N-acetylglucosaminyltransferase [bacterium]